MNKFFKRVLSSVLAVAAAVSSFAVSASADTYKADKLPDSEAVAFVNGMGAGWNLGNAFDAYNCTWVSNKLDYESAWCKAKTTKKLLQSVKKTGFTTLRVPVSWHDHVDSSFNIDADWMNRVREVIDWGLDEGFYVIVNVHHDVEKGFYYPSNAELATSKKYMEKVWQQISDTFKNYDEKLLFEIINEPRLKGTNYEWWYNAGQVPSEVAESLECVNTLNQLSLDTIRKSGGNNKTRYVLVGGYDTNGGNLGICSPYFKMPTDSAKNRLIADIHYYGVNSNDYKGNIDNAYKTFVQKGIPVIYTEYGLDPEKFVITDSNRSKARDITTDFAAYARSKGITVVIWDDNGNYKYIDRATGDLYEADIIKSFAKAGASSTSASSTPTSSSSSDKKNTSVAKPSVTVKSSAKGKATLSWAPVEGATKYAVYRYSNNKLTVVNKKINAVKSGKKQSYTVSGLKSGKSYSFAVKAYVNGKWTTVKKSDIVSVKVK